MVKKVSKNNMKKLLLLAVMVISIGQTACAHPHSHYRPSVVRPACPPTYYTYDYVPYYAPSAPVYYNNWNYNRSYCAPPVISYGFSYNNGRSFGRVTFR